MLRAHTRRQAPYVCTACRRGRSAVSPSRTHLSSDLAGIQLSKAGAHLSTPRTQNQRYFSTSIPRADEKKPSFPGAFAGGAGKFGAFASKAKPVATSGLLPHELAARRQTASEPSTAPLPSNPASTRPANLARSEKNSRSRSVLADIFRSDRQPRSPAATQDDEKKSSTSNIWQEMTKSRRSDTRTDKQTPNKSKAQRSKAPNAPTQSLDAFWNELDHEYKPKTHNIPSQNDRLVPKNTQGESDRAHMQRTDVGDAPLLKPSSSSAPEKQMKKSRFDSETPLPNKKPKKSWRQEEKAYDDDDWDDAERWETLQERKRLKEERKAQKALEPEIIPIFLPEYINAGDLAKALKQRVETFVSDMEEMGFEHITEDTVMTGETAALVAMEYGYEPTVDDGSKRDLQPAPVPEDVSSLPSRPPVVTIMGHVDHGKTTLLDFLRKSSVVDQEHGGITQHIGAFIVHMSNGKQITFLDTPGHAAFLSMRQRGANVTDIVVLVVAADDSVKPQTLEALKHARAANVPIIVAINKVDKEDARVDQVKADLSRHGVEIEDYGGDVQVVCVSGKTGQGMPELEENIITLSEILDVRAEQEGLAEGWLLESSVKQDGKTATVLVKRGTLRLGDHIVAGKTWARVRLLRNEAGQEVSEAPPGTPVEILGWRELPSAGEQVLQAPDEGAAKMAVDYRVEMAGREKDSAYIAQQEQQQREKAAADALAAELAELGDDAEAAEATSDPSVLTQSFIVKADVAGSVEAVCGTILEQGNHEVQSRILRSSAGQVTEYDVDLAAASKSIIINFNSTIPPHIKYRADEAKVRIMDHTVIYHVVDDVRGALSDLLPPLETLRVIGEADILQIFPINITKRVIRNIAGCRVRNGSLKKGSKVKVLRKGEVIFEGSIDTIKHGKKNVQEMGKGTECGIGVEEFEDFAEDDQLQTYEILQEKRKL